MLKGKKLSGPMHAPGLSHGLLVRAVVEQPASVWGRFLREIAQMPRLPLLLSTARLSPLQCYYYTGGSQSSGFFHAHRLALFSHRYGAPVHLGVGPRRYIQKLQRAII